MRLFSLSETVTRGHNLKICKGRLNLDIGMYSFKNRVVDEWIYRNLKLASFMDMILICLNGLALIR